MKPELKASHQRVYDAVFRHPPARNLDWRHVRAMLAALAEVAEQANGNVKFTRGGETLVLHLSAEKNVATVDELMAIRHFLTQSGAAPEPAEVVAEGAHLLVVIDHRMARVYRAEVHGSVPQRIVPYDPGGFGRNLHYVQDDSSGQRKPERKSFYDAVAKTLEGASRVLLFGSGTGSSSAMDHLLAELKQHHPEIAKRVAGTMVVDASHLTEDQLLAKAREFYANSPS